MRALFSILNKNLAGQEAYILLEEVPICEGDNLKEFTEKIIQLINVKTQEKSLSKIKFIVSSIDNPMIYINRFQVKVTQYLKFIEITYWPEEEIRSLNQLLQTQLSVRLDDTFNSKLIVKSKGCPRFIKAFYRNLISISTSESESLEIALRETTHDFYYL
ncbi:hypothetical protein [Fibrisoma limi]|nr:hypothetical protein [Fibrisoma limi]